MMKQRLPKIVSAIAATLLFSLCDVRVDAQVKPAVIVLAAAGISGPMTTAAREFGKATGTNVEVHFVDADQVTTVAARQPYPDLVVYAARTQPPEYLDPVVVAESRVCLLVRESLNPERQPLAIMLDPKVTLLASGQGFLSSDAAEEVFDALASGVPATRSALATKALHLNGSDQLTLGPEGFELGSMTMNIARSRAGAALTYCGQDSQPTLSLIYHMRSVPLPSSIPTITYSMAARASAAIGALAFRTYLLTPQARTIFANWQFDQHASTSTAIVEAERNDLARPVPDAPLRDLKPGDGELRLIKSMAIGTTKYYWLHYRYRYPDGHIEDGDVPWPQVYAYSEHDPYASHDSHVPLQPPPKDFAPVRPLDPILKQLFGGANGDPKPAKQP